jgi:hypothetical protein
MWKLQFLSTGVVCSYDYTNDKKYAPHTQRPPNWCEDIADSSTRSNIGTTNTDAGEERSASCIGDSPLRVMDQRQGRIFVSGTRGLVVGKLHEPVCTRVAGSADSVVVRAIEWGSQKSFCFGAGAYRFMARNTLRSLEDKEVKYNFREDSSQSDWVFTACNSIFDRASFVRDAVLISFRHAKFSDGLGKVSGLSLRKTTTMILAVISLSVWSSAFAQKNGYVVPKSTSCIQPAADFHQVNGWVLASILKVESSFNPRAVNKNRNGTVDVGIGQINSMHFNELSKYGISPDSLQDACIGTYVAAWHLAKQKRAFGNTWFAIGAYHSATPYFNARYQALVYNAMVDFGQMPKPKMTVPPMDQVGGSGKNAGNSSNKPRSSYGSDIFVVTGEQ